MEKKICSHCGKAVEVDSSARIDKYIMPVNEGARWYYDLWHFQLEECSNCGYVNRDLSTPSKFVRVEDLAQSDREIISRLNKVRYNRVGRYLVASRMYEESGEWLNKYLCDLQAQDSIYGEIRYYIDVVLDDDEVDEMVTKLKQFADELYNQTLLNLEEYVDKNELDIDSKIILAGALSDGDKVQVLKSVRLLEQLKKMDLNERQQLMVEFLSSMIRY